METLNLIKALADENRMKIIELLQKYNYCVGSLAKELNISDSAVSQHLKILREAELVDKLMIGHFCYYQVNKETLRTLSKRIKEMASIKPAKGIR